MHQRDDNRSRIAREWRLGILSILCETEDLRNIDLPLLNPSPSTSKQNTLALRIQGFSECGLGLGFLPVGTDVRKSAL